MAKKLKEAQSFARNLDELRTGMPDAQKKAVKVIQKLGKAEKLVMWRRFEKEKTTTLGGNLGQLGVISRKWRERKARAKLDRRKGHAGKGLSKALKHASGFVKLKNGFALSLLRAAFGFTTKTVGGGFVKVSTYFKHYTKAKAQGLGTLTKRQISKIRTAGRKAVNDEIEKIPGVSKDGKRLLIKLNVNTLGLKRRR